MNKNNEIKTIKDALKRLLFNDTKKFQDIPVKDGSKLVIADGAELATGVEIYSLDENGNQIPAEDGSVELADGRTIVIKNGLVDSISEASENPGEDSPQDDANISDPTDVKNDVTSGAAPSGGEDASLESRVSAIENQLAQILELLQGMENTQEVAMNKAFDKLKSAPAVESIKDTPVVDTKVEMKLSVETRKDKSLSFEKKEFLNEVVAKRKELSNKKAEMGISGLNPEGKGSLKNAMAAIKNRKK